MQQIGENPAKERWMILHLWIEHPSPLILIFHTVGNNVLALGTNINLQFLRSLKLVLEMKSNIYVSVS